MPDPNPTAADREKARVLCDCEPYCNQPGDNWDNNWPGCRAGDIATALAEAREDGRRLERERWERTVRAFATSSARMENEARKAGEEAGRKSAKRAYTAKAAYTTMVKAMGVYTNALEALAEKGPSDATD